MDTSLTLLLEIERLTKEHQALILAEDRAGLERGLAQKDTLVEQLKAQPAESFGTEERAVYDRITELEKENMLLLKTDMARTRAMLKKAQEGIITVRGYDQISASVGATYFDAKK